MKRLLILIAFVLLLTGCKATVDVSINEDTVTEKVTLNEEDTSMYNQIKKWDGFPVPLYYDADLEAPLWMPNREKESGVSYCDVAFDDSQNKITATGKFSLNDYDRSSLVRNCFKLFNVITEDNKTIFSTSQGLICAFSNFDIVVSTPYTVVNSNANSSDALNGIYTWKVTDSNKNNISVYLEIDFSKKYNDSNNEKIENKAYPQKEKDKNKYSVIIVVVIIVFVVLFLILYMLIKKKRISNI